MSGSTHIQDLSPPIRIPLERIGFRGLRRRIALETPLGLLQLDVTLDLYVGISGDRRGAHLSRTTEATLEALETRLPARSIEEYLELLAQRMLEKHDYAEHVEVRATTTYYVDVEFGKLRGREPVSVDVEVAVARGGSRVWSVAVTAAGLTACPSAQQTISKLLGIESPKTPTHIQKVFLKGRISSSKGFARIEKLAGALFKSFSAPAFTLLKRVDEAELVLRALSNPKLLEDVVRDAVANIALEFKELPRETVIEVEAESYESIHPHNLYAYKKTTLGEALRALTEARLDTQPSALQYE
ncbi:MAG: GTP cyclohydrolase, FolE2/MptA family [Acidilobaceae archaeon]